MLIRALTVLDSLVVFSLLFAMAYLLLGGAGGMRRGRGRPVPSAALAALALQRSPVGDSLVFILHDMFAAVNLWFISWSGATPFVLFGTVHTLVVLWLAGSALCLGFLCVQYFRLRRELAGLPDFADAAAACAKAGVRRRARVKAGGAMRQVGSWGIFRAWILVPDDFADRFTPADREWMYLHELTHFKRRDALRSLALALWRACFWFNPVCLRAAADVRHGFELACDSAVVGRYGADPLEYSRLIVKTAALERGMPIGFASGFGDVGRRIAALLGERGARRGVRGFAGLAVSLAALGAFAWCYAAAPATKEFHLSKTVVFAGHGGAAREWVLEFVGEYGAFGQYTRAGEIQDVVRAPVPGGDSGACVFL